MPFYFSFQDNLPLLTVEQKKYGQKVYSKQAHLVQFVLQSQMSRIPSPTLCIYVYGLHPDFYHTLKEKQVATCCTRNMASKRKCVSTAEGWWCGCFKSISHLSTDDVNVRECVVDQNFDYYYRKKKKRNIKSSATNI